MHQDGAGKAGSVPPHQNYAAVDANRTRLALGNDTNKIVFVLYRLSRGLRHCLNLLFFPLLRFVSLTQTRSSAVCFSAESATLSVLRFVNWHDSRRTTGLIPQAAGPRKPPVKSDSGLRNSLTQSSHHLNQTTLFYQPRSGRK